MSKKLDNLLKQYDRGEITADEYIDAIAAARQKQAPMHKESQMDFSHSGLGIGGLARHDESAEIAEMIASGQLHIVEHKPRGPMPPNGWSRRSTCFRSAATAT